MTEEKEEELKIQEWDEDLSKKAELDFILDDLKALKQIELDLATIVGSQAEDLKKIEIAQEKSVETTKETGILLKEAALIQGKSLKFKIGARLSAIGAGIGILAGPIGVAIGTTIGAVTGVLIGGKIQKVQKKELDQINL